MNHFNKNFTLIIILIICIICIILNINSIKKNNNSVKIIINSKENIEAEQDDGSNYTLPDDAVGKPAPEKPTIDKTPGSDECTPYTCSMLEEEIPDEDSNIEISSTIKTKIHFLLIAFDIIIIFVITYLILSKFNLIMFKEVYSKKINIIITIISVLSLSFLLYLIENKYLLNNYKSEEKTLQYTEDNYASYNFISQSGKYENIQYISEDYNNNALLIYSAKNTVFSNIGVYKTGGLKSIDHGVEGYNSAILATNDSEVTIKNSKIISAAKGSNGVHSNSGSTINIYDTEINTNDFGSGGIMATVDSTIYAKNLTVTTNGNSSAAIRTDATNAIIEVENGTYTTNGIGSPIVYSTGEIKINNGKLVSNVSEGIVIDGANSVEIENSVLDSNNTKLNGKTTVYSNIMLYNTSIINMNKNSNGIFTAKNSELITRKGSMIHVLDENAIITLENNKITNTDSEGNFLYAMTSGSNKKSNVQINLSSQTIDGNIITDKNSSLKLNMTKSNYKGTINKENESQSIVINLDKESTLTLTGDSYIKSLENLDKTNSNINLNGFKLYINGTILK